MSVLRFLAVLALAFWVGGLVTLGGSASTLFGVIERHDPAGGRDLAAAAFGAIFERFQYASWAAGLVVVASLAIRAALGPRPRHFGVRMWISAGMLAASVSSVWLIAPRIQSIRASSSGSISSLPDTDQRKIDFRRWHRVSTGFMALTIAAGIGLLWAEMKE
jgi:hypothetical protein